MRSRKLCRVCGGGASAPGCPPLPTLHNFRDFPETSAGRQSDDSACAWFRVGQPLVLLGQRLCRGPVPHGQILPTVVGAALRQAVTGQKLSEPLRGLQPRASPQLAQVCDVGAVRMLARRKRCYTSAPICMRRRVHGIRNAGVATSGIGRCHRSCV